MAQIYKTVRGKKLTEVIALNDGVQAELAERTFEMAARAEVLLIEHRAEGHSAIEIDHGDVDWYVVLSDERGQRHALSIEYGRAAGVDAKTGRRYGAMDGLYILHQATNLPKQRKGKVKL
jgi:hypothetical protein